MVSVELVRGEGLIQPLGSGIAEAHRGPRYCGVYILVVLERWGFMTTIYVGIHYIYFCILLYRI